MERVKALVDHAEEYRRIARSSPRSHIRDLLIKAANFCERIAAEMAIEVAKEDSLEMAIWAQRKDVKSPPHH